MEEIKLPKFKTKEELEQFAIGLMTENKSLKKDIAYKDGYIEGLEKVIISLSNKYIGKQEMLQDLESCIAMLKEKVKELSQQPSQKCEVNYKGMYESEVERVRLRDDIGDVLYKSMSWLYSRVPFLDEEEIQDLLSTAGRI